MKLQVEYTVKIDLDGDNYLIEPGDYIIVENLSKDQKAKILDRFKVDSIANVDEFKQRVGDIKNHLRKAIGTINKKIKEADKPATRDYLTNVKHDVMGFIDNELYNFLLDNVAEEVREAVNQDRIKKFDMADEDADEKAFKDDAAQMAKAREREREAEQKKMFGQSAKEFAKQRKAEREAERKRMFESVYHVIEGTI